MAFLELVLNTKSKEEYNSFLKFDEEMHSFARENLFPLFELELLSKKIMKDKEGHTIYYFNVTLEKEEYFKSLFLSQINNQIILENHSPSDN